MKISNMMSYGRVRFYSFVNIVISHSFLLDYHCAPTLSETNGFGDFPYGDIQRFPLVRNMLTRHVLVPQRFGGSQFCRTDGVSKAGKSPGQYLLSYPGLKIEASLCGLLWIWHPKQEQPGHAHRSFRKC
jgi:hypothetical protein